MGRIAVSAGGSSGDGVKVVHHRLRHGSAETTLNTYGQLWPDSDESARAAAGAVLRPVRTRCGLAAPSFGKTAGQ